MQILIKFIVGANRVKALLRCYMLALKSNIILSRNDFILSVHMNK